MKPRLGDPLAASPPPHRPRESVFKLLDHFLIGKGPIQLREVPWPLNRLHIVDYVRERLEEDELSPLAASRVPLLADAYLLHELPEVILPHLQQQEGSAEAIWRSSSLCAAIGNTGDTQQRRFAANYLRQLVRSESAAEILAELVPGRDALGPFLSSEELQSAMNARAQTLLADDDFDAEVEGQDLEDMAANTLEDLDEADEVRAGFEQLRDNDERLALLLDVYLERSDCGGEEFLLPWSVREIRRQAHVRGAEPILTSLLAELQLTRDARDSDEDAAFVAVRLVRAILYFGGQPESKDTLFLGVHCDDQSDPLSIERLLPEADVEWMTAEGAEEDEEPQEEPE